MIPYIIATSFFALACSVFFSDSDAPLLMIAFFSVGLIFLSGVSYPLELMPWYWQWTHYLIPAAPGTLAFVKINSMGADMSGISQQYIILWMQCVGYFILACLAYRYNMKKHFLLHSIFSLRLSQYNKSLLFLSFLEKVKGFILSHI